MLNQSLDGFFRIDQIKGYTYKEIEVKSTQTKVSSITFSPIEYEDGLSSELLISVFVPAKSFELRLQFNGDETSGKYASRTLSSMHTTLAQESTYIPTLVGTHQEDEKYCVFGFITLYADKTEIYKQVQSYSPNTFGTVGSGLWRSTDSINSVNFSCENKFPLGTFARLLIATKKAVG